MSDNAWNPGEVGVTIKYGKGYDETWSTFRGTIESVKAQLIEFFGLDSASVSMTLHEVSVNATQVAHGLGAVATNLGGTVIASGPSEQVNPATASSTPSDPWASVSGESAPAENPLLAQIAAATDAEALKLLWANNQAAFSDAAVMDAWKARGKALQNAA